MTDPEVPYLGAKRLRELLERGGAKPNRSLGQNFVIDPNTIRKVVRTASVGPGDRVLEIGAGPGSLTLGLVAQGAEVIAIEVDRALFGILEEVTGHFSGVEALHADARDVDLAALGATKMVANLPYNIAATLVVNVLEQAPGVRSLTVMTQKEVGERLAAEPGTKIYGVTTLLAAFYSEVTIAGRVSRRAFFPEPNVDSVIVKLDRRATPEVDPVLFKRIVKAAFAQRRKTVRNSLAPAVASAEAVESALEKAGIGSSERAEDVPFVRFVALTTELALGRG